MSGQIPTGIEALVCGDIAARQALGIKKYGQTVADNPLPLRAWLRHGYEEALDLAVYLRRSMAEIDARGGCLSDPDIVQNLVHMAKGRNEAAEAISRLLDAQVAEIKRLREKQAELVEECHVQKRHVAILTDSLAEARGRLREADERHERDYQAHHELAAKHMALVAKMREIEAKGGA
jgi:septal ring factor EnvC (AmiA/AmiB activator)